MSAPSPVLDHPPAEHDGVPEQLVLRPRNNVDPIDVNSPRVGLRQEIVRSLPMLGIGGIVVGSIAYPPSVIGGIVLIGAEVALAAFAIRSWYPQSKAK